MWSRSIQVMLTQEITCRYDDELWKADENLGAADDTPRGVFLECLLPVISKVSVTKVPQLRCHSNFSSWLPAIILQLKRNILRTFTRLPPLTNPHDAPRAFSHNVCVVYRRLK